MKGLRSLRNISGLLGAILKWFGFVFLVPMGVAYVHGTSVVPFVIPLLVSLVGGFLLETQSSDRDLETADGFLLVVLTWFSVSILGALPYVIASAGSLGTPVNAIFESVSGFTCTGSTVMDTISLEKHPYSIMLWRQMTQWLGGMGILVLAVAILPRLSAGGAQFLDQEVPGPRMERLTPHIAATARRLWILYIGISILMFSMLFGLHLAGWAPRMNAFQAVSHTFSGLATGGFSPESASIGAFSNPVQWVIIAFVFIGAMNFTLIWRFLFSSFKDPFHDTEFTTYLFIFLVAGVVVSLLLLGQEEYTTLEECFRHGFFQATTVLTSAGFASTDFAVWSGEILLVLFVLMFATGCIGSTAGGIKIMRWVVAVKVAIREMFQMVHPSSVRPIRLGSRVLKIAVVRGILTMILMYLGLVFGSSILVALDTHLADLNLSEIEIMSSVAATIGNIGPGLGKVGPMENFEFLPPFTKVWLSLLMIAGRLEIMTLIVVLTPAYWSRG